MYLGRLLIRCHVITCDVSFDENQNYNSIYNKNKEN